MLSLFGEEKCFNMSGIDLPFAKAPDYCPSPPPMLTVSDNHVEGLAFIGLSLTRHYSSEEESRAHPQSITRQTAFDFNDIQDRDYEYFAATNDDGWLTGGGESEASYKLPNPDSAHCEIMRVGTLERALGGVDAEDIVAALSSGRILIPHMAVMPSFLLQNNDSPPEIELKFEMEPNAALPVDEWPNWQLQFLHNQLFNFFQFPARFCPGPFHMTIVRKAAFRSSEHRQQYFEHCNGILQRWRDQGALHLCASVNSSHSIKTEEYLENELEHPHGVYLYRHRMLPVTYFQPNFHPPYNTPEKRAIIMEVICQTWDERSMMWKPSSLRSSY